MGATLSLVRATHPDGVTAASQTMQTVIADLEALIDDQQQGLTRLSSGWTGGASDAATRQGHRKLQDQRAFQCRLSTIRMALQSGGRQLSELRAQILSTADQACSLGGIVADDGSVRPSVAGLLMTQPLAAAYAAVLRELLRAFDSVDAATASTVRGASSNASSADVQAIDFVVGGEPPQAPPGQPLDSDIQRQNQLDAFAEVFGREPRTPTDWQTATALDPHSYSEKYSDEPPRVVVGRIEPVPGQGVVKSGLFIPRDVVFNVPRDDLGDNRGFDPHFSPEDTRVGIYVDYENGLVIARQNPSVDVDGNVRVLTPEIKVQQAPGGAVRIQYEAANAFAPPGAEVSGHVVRGDIVVTPGAGNAAASVDGVLGDYPSLEVYQDLPTGDTYTLAQDAADSGNVYGPLTELPFSHEIGRGASAFEPFESQAPQLPGGPRYPGDTIPYVPGRVDPNAPTELAPTNRIPNVVVVK